VAAGVEAGGVLEVGVLQAHRVRLLVHVLDEDAHAPAAQVLGEGVDGFGAGGDQGRLEELPDAQALALYEPDVAVDGSHEALGLPADGDLLLEVRPLLEGQEGDHDLGRRGYG
jgi:hypothetical protein